MTAIDTTNLRLSFTVPDHGMVRVKLGGVLHGATTVPQVLLGVMDGATVRGRVAPMLGGGNIAATTKVRAEVDFVLSGLTPGAVNWDAAYSVDVLVAATGLKYGGPNNTTTNDAFGGFTFEIYDPAPAGGAGGGATAQEVWEYSTRALTANPGLTAAQVNAEVDTALSDIGLTTTVTGRIDAAVSTRLAASGYTAPLSAAGVRSAVGLSSANLDAQLDALPTAAEIHTELGELALLDAPVSTRLGVDGYTTPDNAGITAIKTQTDKLVWTSSGCLKVDVFCINGVQVYGAGSVANKWRGVE